MCWTAGVWFRASRESNFSLLNIIQTGCGAQLDSYLMVDKDFFLGAEAVVVLNWPLSYSGEVKIGGVLPPLLHTSFWHGA
jgi:hypothetical protein